MRYAIFNVAVCIMAWCGINTIRTFHIEYIRIAYFIKSEKSSLTNWFAKVTWFFPLRLLKYSAVSAFRSSVAHAVPSSGYRATPILQETPHERNGSSSKAVKIAWKRSAQRLIGSIPFMAGRKAMNSSPPIRPKISVGRRAPWNCSPIEQRRSSPRWCPRWSFTCLKLSRSINNKAAGILG